MLVREAMTVEVVSVSPQDTVHRVAQLLAEHRISTVPVVDAVGRLLGVVGESEVVASAWVPGERALAVPVRSGPATAYAGDVMFLGVATVRPWEDVAEAAQVMVEADTGCVPVVQGATLVGMLSRSDIVRQLARRDERVRSELGELVRRAERSWQVEVTDGEVTVFGPVLAHDVRLARLLAGGVRGVTGVHVVPGPLPVDRFEDS